MSLEKEHLFYKMGARSGDVVISVNGFKLDGVDILFELSKSLPTASNVKLEIQRYDKKFDYNVNIKE